MKVMKVCLLLAALVAITGVASAEVTRVIYDYDTNTESGLWTVTVDSSQLPWEAGGTAVTFEAPMATAVFTQIDTLNGGEVAPVGTKGWINDESNSGEFRGMTWKLYESTDTVTLTAVTPGFEDHTWTIQTILAGSQDDIEETESHYRWTADLLADPVASGYDLKNERIRAASWWGDVEPGADGGNRHSGTRRDYSEENKMWAVGDWFVDLNEDGECSNSGEVFATEALAIAAAGGLPVINHSDGVDAWTEDRDGPTATLDQHSNGDGIGFAISLRDEDNGNLGSVFVSNVTFGGDVFADTNGIPEPATMLLLGLGGLLLRRKR